MASLNSAACTGGFLKIIFLRNFWGPFLRGFFFMASYPLITAKQIIIIITGRSYFDRTEERDRYVLLFLN